MGLSNGCLMCNIPFSRVYYHDICHACAIKLAQPFICKDRERIIAMINNQRSIAMQKQEDTGTIFERILNFIESEP